MVDQLPGNLTCIDVDYNSAEGISVLSVVVVSFAFLCLVMICTLVTAKRVANRSQANFDSEDHHVIIDDPERPSVFGRAISRQDTTVVGQEESVCDEVFEENSSDLDNVYDQPTNDAQKIYGPIMIRSPRRSSSLFPPIDEDHVTSGEDSPMSFGAISSNRASCVSGHNYQVTQQPRGAAIRSSTSSGIIKLRKSSDMLRVPSNIEHGTLVRTRSQEQVERLTEFLFSGKERNELLLDPNSIFSDDASRRASSTSSGKRKISVDHLLANFGISSEYPGSAKSQRRRESTPIVGTPNVVKREDVKSLKQSITSTDLIPTNHHDDDMAKFNELVKKHKVPTVSRIVREFEKFATLRSKHFTYSESVAEETDSSSQFTVDSVLDTNAESSVKNIFVKNRKKNSGTVPKNLQYLQQISTGISPRYRRHRRPGIHVVSSDSTEV